LSKAKLKSLEDCVWFESGSAVGRVAHMSDEPECRKLCLETCIPQTATESFLIKLWRCKKEKAKEYSAKRDKVKISEMLENHFLGWLENYAIIIELEAEVTGASWEELVTIESFSKSVLNSVCKCYRQSCMDVYTSIANGAFLYNSSSINSIPLSDTHPAYSAVWNWSSSETEFPQTINEYWPCDITKLYVSKYEIAHSDMFSPGDEETDSEYELEVRRTAYRAHLTDTLARKSETEARTSQKDRELVLLGWMAAKGLKKGAKIEGGYSHKSLWNELVEYCPDQFPPTLGTDAIKKFFRDAKGICRFK
jgi:hypothetical protein